MSNISNWSVESEGGQTISEGLDELTARRVAQTHANETGETVYLYQGVGNEPETIEPEPDEPGAPAVAKIDLAIEQTRKRIADKSIDRDQRRYARLAIDLVEGTVAGEASEVAEAREWLLGGLVEVVS
jgi:hypothetical protein